MALKLKTKHKIALIASAVLIVAALSTAAATQPDGPAYGPGSVFMGPGMMGPGMGNWMMGRRGPGGMCNPAANGFAEWRADRLAELVQLTDPQRVKFDEFKAASIKAAEAMRTACLTDSPTTIVGRAEVLEKRMDAMLQAVHEMRPALEGFYATLSDAQKVQLDSGFDRGRFWHWRDRW